MLNKEVFIKHRKNVFSMMLDNSVLIQFSRKKEESDVNSKLDINRNYYYLSGNLEFENIIIITKNNNRYNEMIFINPYDEYKAKWVGAPLSKEEIIKSTGINNVYYLDSFNNVLNNILSQYKNIYLELPQTELDLPLTLDEIFANKIKNKYPWINIINSIELLSLSRMKKEPEEIEIMKKAIDITSKGLENVLCHIGPKMEYQLESYFDQAIKYNGATGYAFNTIAARGDNACCLHYCENNSMANEGDLILFDLGASVNMYCADISRTYPINGKFSPRQKELYDIVLGAQNEVFKACKVGVTTKDLNQVVIKYYQKELKRIGLIKNDDEVSKYYYHGVSHHIGLNCHDLAKYGVGLEEGNIISNEPGLYIQEEDIGIRIEDDMLVTKDGAIWLSPQILKTTEEIEAFIEKNRKDK